MLDVLTVAGVSGVTVQLGGLADYPITYYDDPCDYRFEESAKVRQHGIWPDYTWMGKRAPEVHFDVLAPDPFTYNERRLALMSALVPMPELGYTYVCILNCIFTGYESMFLNADVDSISIPRDGGEGPAIGHCQAIFRSAYPFYQSSNTYSVDLGAPSSGTSGRTYPKTYPFSYGSGATSGGSATAHPGGNVTTYPQFTITGPAVNPVVARNDGGTLTSFILNYSLAAGEVVVIDMAKRTVVTNLGIDITNLRDPSSIWFGLYANQDNNLLYRPYQSDTGTDCTCTWLNNYHF